MPDHFGLLKPTAVVYHPNNGDLAFVSVLWPLALEPSTGLNEAGLAISTNWFPSDDPFGLARAQHPMRLVMEKARTVAEAIEMITSMRERQSGGFFSLADAAGNIAEVECTAHDCAVYRPGGDWYAQANIALTDKMLAHQPNRSSDSVIRQAAMEAAVRPQVGKIDPVVASEILRYRGNTQYLNDSTVGSIVVLNSIVVQPASRTIWVSTRAQPFAPFGEFTPFDFSRGGSVARPLPSGSYPEMSSDAALVGELRAIARQLNDGNPHEANAIAGRLAGNSRMNPTKLALLCATTAVADGRFADAYALLGPFDSESKEVQPEIQFVGRWLRAEAAILLDKRPEAASLAAKLKYYARANQTTLQNGPGVQKALKFIEDGVAAIDAHQAPQPLPDRWWRGFLPWAGVNA